MSINEQIFTDLVKTYLESSDYKETREDDILKFEFKSKSNETDILIYCDPDEYTVCIGDYFHTHFDIYSCSGETKEKQFKEASEHAIGFIQAFMRNEIWLSVSFVDGEAKGASICDDKETYSAVIPVVEDENKSEVVEKIFKWD